MPVITRNFGSVALTLAYGDTDDQILGYRASLQDWGNTWPENAPSNIIYAGDGNDTVRTGFGNDIAFGGAGNDILIGYGTGGPTPSAALAIADRVESDYLNGGPGNDALHGGGGRDTLIGGTGNDELHGGRGADLLYGGAGDDTLIGGGDSDWLWGGAGADTFVYGLAPSTPDASYPGEPADIIMDFQPGTDKLDLRGYGATDDNTTLTPTAMGLTVSIDFLGTPIGIELRGVSALQAGDIIYAA